MSEVTDTISVIHRLQRMMQDQMESLIQTLAQGGVDNMENYKYIVGKIHAIDMIQQDLSNLLEPKEPKNDDPNNITRIGK